MQCATCYRMRKYRGHTQTFPVHCICNQLCPKKLCSYHLPFETWEDALPACVPTHPRMETNFLWSLPKLHASSCVGTRAGISSNLSGSGPVQRRPGMINPSPPCSGNGSARSPGPFRDLPPCGGGPCILAEGSSDLHHRVARGPKPARVPRILCTALAGFPVAATASHAAQWGARAGWDGCSGHAGGGGLRPRTPPRFHRACPLPAPLRDVSTRIPPFRR